mmetsp:Transcript_12113/g.10733  ORF Transcript_12113/g.10733 Transcript_12113/m.10733 type:complete len:177 (+) Transcript_12113:202-732(+)
MFEYTPNKKFKQKKTKRSKAMEVLNRAFTKKSLELIGERKYSCDQPSVNLKNIYSAEVNPFNKLSENNSNDRSHINHIKSSMLNFEEDVESNPYKNLSLDISNKSRSQNIAVNKTEDNFMRRDPKFRNRINSKEYALNFIKSKINLDLIGFNAEKMILDHKKKMMNSLKSKMTLKK